MSQWLSSLFLTDSLGQRRVLLALLAAGISALLLALAWHVLNGGGWTIWEILIFVCLTLNAPWAGLTSATGMVGSVLLLLHPDPSMVAVPALRRLEAEKPITSRVAVALCIRLEDPISTFAAAERLLGALRAGPGGDRFTLAILSDTPSGTMADAEAAAAGVMATRHDAGAVFYRRRSDNIGFKAGNLMDFIDQHSVDIDFVLVLDADSVMSAVMVRRLVQIMQLDPGLAILQPNIAGCETRSDFARLFAFGHLHRSRAWTVGQAWWQGPSGPYWGHNALLRVVPFRQHCRLPPLPNGRLVLSHDHVEAALLHGADWAVRVLPEDSGSAEQHPPDLIALLKRDVRWAAGNLQYRHLMRDRTLGRLGRFQMAQAVMYYVLAPSWFACLPLAAANVAVGGGAGTPRSALLALLLLGYILSNTAKLGGFTVAIGRAHRTECARLLQSIGQEVLFGLLTDPVMILDRAAIVIQLIIRPNHIWERQQRDALGLSWTTALRRFWAHTAVGLVLLSCFASGGRFALIASLPVVLGLLVSIPLSIATAQPRSPWSNEVLHTQPADL